MEIREESIRLKARRIVFAITGRVLSWPMMDFSLKMLKSLWRMSVSVMPKESILVFAKVYLSVSGVCNMMRCLMSFVLVDVDVDVGFIGELECDLRDGFVLRVSMP